MIPVAAGHALTAHVREAVAACLRVLPGEIDAGAPLTRYGLDSLNAVELAAELERVTGIELAPETLFDHSSVAALAEHLSAPAQGGASPPLQRMLADSVLPPDIDPSSAIQGGPGPLLLTGANGFLGVHVLAALLEAGAQEIVCLVRAVSDEQARERLLEAARRYSVAADFPQHRVRVIAGDIGRTRLGMDLPRYEALCAEVGRVLHCAASVDWACAYEALALPNVGGTIELLRFASRVRRKAFHFVSSISACYSTRGPRCVSEADGVSADPSGIHLGYAQTKWVDEALVRAAAARGLETAIYRPGLIAGHSVSGAYNSDDFLARLVKGCIALGAAPDIAWPIDACPVDFVASALARMSLRNSAGCAVAHLTNPRTGRWPEAVLWMRLRGYRVQLVPYARWAALVEAGARDPLNPLHGLRGFLLKRPAGEGGRFLPELYAEPHVTRIDARVTHARLADDGIECPALDPQLLQTWFDGYVRSGFLAPAVAVRRLATQPDPVPALEALLRGCCEDPLLTIAASRRVSLGDGNSILGELASWHAGARLTLQAFELDVVTSAGMRRVDVVLKPRPGDAAVMEVACEVAALCNPRLGAAFSAHWMRTPFAGTASREIALHRSAYPAVLACAPASFGALELGAQRVLVLEHVRGVELNDAARADEQWRQSHVEAALTGIARVHAAWYGREAELRALDWLGPVLDAATVRDTHELWVEVAEHARPFLAQWAGAAAGRLLRKLARAAPERAQALAAMPRTLVHHDFNPRNIGFRPRRGRAELCAFDWELATIAVPQRDLAELLCFVLPPSAPAALVSHFVELHRVRVEHDAGRPIDAHQWREGYRLALADFGVQRLGLYVTAHRLRSRPYLERVAQTWMHLVTLAESHAVVRAAAVEAA